MQGFPIASFALLQYSSTSLKVQLVNHEGSGGRRSEEKINKEKERKRETNLVFSNALI